ncbi:hypothetical protein [Cellulomonas sp. PhB143]|uniref:hypothetical protein n=1 Tax=Cellulomonas sp. PhB143 TaxID=2485186 RepID=UPI000F482850|nr:hypothetical protein [Cellulomonas sp. PhB143]ROS74537.1 hypothetical protein EDF32_2284 [Cellulomonas sp. PhB143]
MNDAWTAVLRTLTVLVALAVSTGAGAWVVPVVLRAASRRPDDGAPPSGPGQAPPDPDPAAGPTGTVALEALRGGTWIGLLERFAVTGCLLVGYPAGIALVVAVKGLGRYPELRERPAASERFVVGTLASMLWAVSLGLAGSAVLGLLR